jgi:hypothetical protein
MSCMNDAPPTQSTWRADGSHPEWLRRGGVRTICTVGPVAFGVVDGSQEWPTKEFAENGHQAERDR